MHLTINNYQIIGLAPCRLILVEICFGGICCFRHEGRRGSVARRDVSSSTFVAYHDPDSSRLNL
jgi:hypothetical protein